MVPQRKRRVLVVDDKAEHREPLRQLLSDVYDVETAENGEDAVKLAAKSIPDLILLDILMPRMDGMATCEALRKQSQTASVPIIMLTCMNSVENKVRAFDLGVDDFVSKPFEIPELLARMKARIDSRVWRKVSGSKIECGNLELDVDKYETRISGRVVKLSTLEFNLLKFLVQNMERVVTREQILEAVWKHSVVNDRTVDTHLAYLRKKLEGFNHSLSAVYGAGYILKPMQS